MIRLALAAPSAMLLAGLESLLASDGSHVVVERTSRLESLSEMLEGAEVDVVVAVADEPSRLRLPAGAEGGSVPAGDGGDGGARTLPVDLPVVLLVDTPPGASLAEWLRRGVRAVLPRDAEPREIHAAIEGVAAGMVVVPASEVAALVGPPARRKARLTGQLQPPAAPLSPREREILGLMAEGLVNKIIAARLGISEHTVKTHVASIFAKLDAETRAEAVAIGARSGVILL